MGWYVHGLYIVCSSSQVTAHMAPPPIIVASPPVFASMPTVHTPCYMRSSHIGSLALVFAKGKLCQEALPPTRSAPFAQQLLSGLGCVIWDTQRFSGMKMSLVPRWSKQRQYLFSNFTFHEKKRVAGTPFSTMRLPGQSF